MHGWEKIAPRTGFELRISGIGSDRSTNCATTTGWPTKKLSFTPSHAANFEWTQTVMPTIVPLHPLPLPVRVWEWERERLVLSLCSCVSMWGCVRERERGYQSPVTCPEQRVTNQSVHNSSVIVVDTNKKRRRSPTLLSLHFPRFMIIKQIQK